MVVLGAALALLGSFYIGFRAQINVNRSTNPARAWFKYAFGFVGYEAGLVLVVWFSPCRHLSAWLIAFGVFAVTVASKIWGQAMGYRIPELHPVAGAIVAAFVIALIVALARPAC